MIYVKAAASSVASQPIVKEETASASSMTSEAVVEGVSDEAIANLSKRLDEAKAKLKRKNDEIRVLSLAKAKATVSAASSRGQQQAHFGGD